MPTASQPPGTTTSRSRASACLIWLRVEHEQGEERHRGVESTEAGVDGHHVAVQEGRLRHVAASEADHDRRDVDAGHLAARGGELERGGQPGARADVEHAGGLGQPVQQELDEVPLAFLVREHLVVASPDLVERGSLGMLAACPGIRSGVVGSHGSHTIWGRERSRVIAVPSS